jgi:hypothetical protein
MQIPVFPRGGYFMSVQNLPTSKTNSMAIVSLVSGILAWIITIISLCISVGILPIITVATCGFGGILYVIVLIPGSLSTIGWLVAVFTGHVAKSQIKQTSEKGEGIATAGLIMGYVGLGLTLLSICLIIILIIAGVPILDQLSNYNYGY